MYLILTILLLVTQVYSWETKIRNKWVDINLETTSLEIVSDDEPGSDRSISVAFYRTNKDPAGGLRIKYSSAISYRFPYCDKAGNFREFDNLPSAKVKVWRITVTRQTDAVSMQIYCNDELVLETKITDDSCADKSGDDWTKVWNSGPITKINFTPLDTASDFYQAALSCDAGNYRAIGDAYKSVASSCTKCPTDTTSPAGSTSVDDCKKVCEAGQYLSGSDCKTCGENTFSGNGASACTNCPADTTSPAGSKSTEDCKKGEEDCAKTFTCSGAVIISVSAALAAAAFLATILI